MEKSAVAETGLPQEQKLFVRKAFVGTMKILWLIFLGLSIFQMACAPSRKTPPSHSQASSSRDQLFPNGVYIHQVKIFPKNGKVRKVKVVVSIAPQTIRLVGLSPLNSTLFKYIENRNSGEHVMESYGPLPDEIKSEMESFFKILRQLLVFRLGQADDHELGEYMVEYDDSRFPISLKTKDQASAILLSDYDEHKIPRKLKASHPLFEALVGISSYELDSEE